MNTVGIYFSANDIVYDWAIAFLNSFRTFNPDLRLILIPFNDDCDHLLKLQDTYNFEIYTDPSFERLEAIGKAFELGYTPTGPYWFRRYAAFWGPCDHFMYLDARQVVLADLKPVIQALDDYDFELLHFDCAINQVYEPGELRRELLSQGKARGFNSGRWASRKGLFTLDEFEQFATEAFKVRRQLNPRNTDQAFINYCCDMKPVRYGHVAEVLGNVCQTSWARQPGKIYRDSNSYYLWDYGGLNHKKRLLLVHWAGYRLNALMPQKHLFNQFSTSTETILFKILVQLKDLIEFIPKRFFMLLRTNRLINGIYHQFNQKSIFDELLIERDKLPTFICIGGQRCGSTWLNEILQAHQNVTMSPKEFSFFNLRIRTEGFESYYACFPPSSDQSQIVARGDVTPTYSAMFVEEVKLVKALLPDLKIIFIIRNPVDRLISSITRGWTYTHLDKGAPTDRGILALLRQVDTGISVRLSDYRITHKTWSYFFGENQVLVKKYDDLAKDPKKFAYEVFQFIEVENTECLSDDLFFLKPNSSKFKDEIPPMLNWYLAVKWLPEVKLLQEDLQHLDFTDWIKDMEEIALKGKFSWQVIRIFHSLYFVLPYQVFYFLFNIFRIKIRVFQNQQATKSLAKL